MNEVENQKYWVRMERVCDFIYANLDQELSVEVLSQVANFSKYHFHRQFFVYTGVNVSRYVQMLRLKRASYKLVFQSELPIIDIALEAGFENPESFSRAFKSAFSQTPSQFRTDPDWISWNQKYEHPEPRRKQQVDVQIVDFKETKIAVLEHLGSPNSLMDSVAKFIEWRKSTGLSPVESSRTFGIAYSDPNTTPPEQFRFDACGSVEIEVPQNPQGVINKVIPAGRCAVVRHLGSRDDMEPTIYALYREWLPAHDEEWRDFPLFFEYINLFPEVPEHELITDIFLPIK